MIIPNLWKNKKCPKPPTNKDIQIENDRKYMELPWKYHGHTICTAPACHVDKLLTNQHAANGIRIYRSSYPLWPATEVMPQLDDTICPVHAGLTFGVLQKYCRGQAMPAAFLRSKCLSMVSGAAHSPKACEKKT